MPEPIPTNIFLITNDISLINMVSPLPPPQILTKDGIEMRVWINLDWMDMYLIINKLEIYIAQCMPRDNHYYLRYGDAYEGAWEHGTLNPFNLRLERTYAHS